MGPTAAYDEIAEWYEHEFLRRQGDRDPLGIDRAVRELLGPGSGTCLEVGCGTGIHAARVRQLGWTPLGVDLSAGMLRYARDRLPVALADAVRLPVADGSVPVVLSAMTHTDMSDYPAVLREVARVLEPGGRFVHIGVHPCFCGGFADHTDRDAVVIRPGYLDATGPSSRGPIKAYATRWVRCTGPSPSCCTPSSTPGWPSTGSPRAAPPPRSRSPSTPTSHADGDAAHDRQRL